MSFGHAERKAHATRTRTVLAPFGYAFGTLREHQFPTAGNPPAGLDSPQRTASSSSSGCSYPLQNNEAQKADDPYGSDKHLHQGHVL